MSDNDGKIRVPVSGTLVLRRSDGSRAMETSRESGGARKVTITLYAADGHEIFQCEGFET